VKRSASLLTYSASRGICGSWASCSHWWSKRMHGPIWTTPRLAFWVVCIIFHLYVICILRCNSVWMSHWSKRLYLLTYLLIFLPRDAMLARYLLSSCVRPSVYHKPALPKRLT